MNIDKKKTIGSIASELCNEMYIYIIDEVTTVDNRLRRSNV